ncbi:hypothetical protein WMF27_32505 [Sorangium sp. So ce281]|uniref:hypothetical protein n=1 Tax=unclassified Sorangium TaxID=2621164 RepID=UPI003F641B4A
MFLQQSTFPLLGDTETFGLALSSYPGSLLFTLMADYFSLNRSALDRFETPLSSSAIGGCSIG